ncbi:MAG: hypothetical protein KC910_17650 [Candidatus Eremiobacteraeota bacterium]|nr:hypothetical protein [Candidatus Eremiobacteraeota bacterium]
MLRQLSRARERFSWRKAATGALLAGALLFTGCNDSNNDFFGGTGGQQGRPINIFGITVYVSNNGAGNAGQVDQTDQVFTNQATSTPGNNEGVDLDPFGNLYQAGDLAAGSLRVFSKVKGRTTAFNVVSDREITGANTTLTNPKGIARANARGLVIIADFGTDLASSGLTVFGENAGGNVPPMVKRNVGARPWDVAYDETNDRLYVAFTNGTIGVFDTFVGGNFAPGGAPTRVITPVDGNNAQLSTNIHGIVFDPLFNRIIASDVGAANAGQGANFASDGSIYVIANAATATGNVQPVRVIRGDQTMLGNPVDISYDGLNLRVAEKANNKLLIFASLYLDTTTNAAPDVSVNETSPESLVVQPQTVVTSNDTSDLDGINTITSVITSSNPGTGAATTGEISRLNPALTTVVTTFGANNGTFPTALFAVESVKVDRLGNGYATFDMGNTGPGGIFVLNRVGTQRNGDNLFLSEDRVITGAATGLQSPKGLDLVESRDAILVADLGTGTIRRFGKNADGNVAPTLVTTPGVNPWDVDYDPRNDRLFVALTNGTIGVYDNYFANNPTGAPDRIITPNVTPASMNIHGIIYDAANDALIVSDIGSPADATDGKIYVISNVATLTAATNNPVPSVRIAGAATQLGNPVDLAFDGANLYVAEKSNGQILRFDSVRVPLAADPNRAPSASIARTAPESVTLLPPASNP